MDDGYFDDSVEKLGAHKPAGILRGGKYSLFDAGTHVPFFVSWKNNIQPETSNALICQIDFLASFAKMLGLQINENFDSQNMLSALLGKSKKGRKELVIESMGRLAYITPEWSFIPSYAGDKTNKTGNELGNLPSDALFNLIKDESQKKNLADKNIFILKKLKSRLKKLTKGY